MSDPRFGDWSNGEKPVVEGRNQAAGAAEKPPEKPVEKPEAAAKTPDETPEAEIELSPEELRDKIKGLEKDLVKQRTKKRSLNEELATVRKELESLKSKQEIKVEDFDSYDDYVKAVDEKSKPEPKKVGTEIDIAVAALARRAEKAGVDQEALIDDLGTMKHLPAAAILTMADRRDAVQVAQWLIQNEDSEEAQEALNALTEAGRQRAFDAIADLIKSKPTKPEKDQPKTQGVKPITRIGSQGSGSKDLSKLKTDEYIQERQSGSGRSRFW